MIKREEDKLVIKGALTSFRHGINKFDKDTEKYYISIKIDPETLPDEERQLIHDEYFADAKEKYIPDLFKVDAKGKVLPIEGDMYLNLKSIYDITIFIAGKGNERFPYEEFIRDHCDNLAPYGSKVTLSARLKDGAVYPLAVRFDTIVKASADDFF